jgi:hypothetical protein
MEADRAVGFRISGLWPSMAPAYRSSGAEWWHLIIALKESLPVAWHAMGQPTMVWLWGPMLSVADGSAILIRLMGLRRRTWMDNGGSVSPCSGSGWDATPG